MASESDEDDPSTITTSLSDDVPSVSSPPLPSADAPAAVPHDGADPDAARDGGPPPPPFQSEVCDTGEAGAWDMRMRSDRGAWSAPNTVIVGCRCGEEADAASNVASHMLGSWPHHSWHAAFHCVWGGCGAPFALNGRTPECKPATRRRPDTARALAADSVNICDANWSSL